MATRLTIRNPLNNGWLDQCNSEWRFRDGQNRSWVRFYPEQTSIRNSGNNEWNEVDCAFDEVLDDPCAALARFSSTVCATSVDITEAGSGDGRGSGGQLFDILDGYPAGYDLPDAGEVGFGVEIVQGSFENKVISRPGIEFAKETYGSEAINSFYGRGTYANPSYVNTHTFSVGTAIAESIYQLGDTQGFFEILYASYHPDGISIDVYYLGALIASTCGRVTGRGKLEFPFDPNIGAGEDRVMIRVRGEDKTQWMYNLHGPKQQLGLALFEPDNISHLAAVRTTEYIGTPIFPAPTHARVFPFEERVFQGQYWYEYTHTLEFIDNNGDSRLPARAQGPYIVHINYETWENADWIEVYHGGKRVASTLGNVTEDGLLEIVFDAYRFATPVPDIVVKVMASERLIDDSDIMSQEYMMYDANTPGYKENRWPCETPTNGITSAGHYSTEDHFIMNSDVPRGVASVTLEATDTNTVITLAIFDKNGELIDAQQGQGAVQAQWFRLPEDPRYDDLLEVSIRVDAPIDAGWTYEVGCYVPILDIELNDELIPACPEIDDIDISINDTTVVEGSKARFDVKLNYPTTQDISVDFVTADVTASSSGAPASTELNPYWLYANSNLDRSGFIYKDETEDFTLWVENDASRFMSWAQVDGYFYDNDPINYETGPTAEATSSYASLPAYYKAFVNSMQNRIGTLDSSKRILVITHQRIIYSTVTGDPDWRYTWPNDNMLDHLVTSLNNIYGVQIDVQYGNRFVRQSGAEYNGQQRIEEAQQASTPPQNYYSFKNILANYDAIVIDRYNKWGWAQEESDVSNLTDFIQKAFDREQATAFATELARVAFTSSPKFIAVMGGMTKTSSTSADINSFYAMSTMMKDIINGFGLKNIIDIPSHSQRVAVDSPAPVSIQNHIDENGDHASFAGITTTDQFNTQESAQSLVLFEAGDGATGGTAGDGIDYQARSGTVTIPAGASSIPIEINTYSDTISDPNETFTVTISNPTGGNIVRAVGTATIRENVVGVPPSSGDIEIVYGQIPYSYADGYRGFTTINYPDATIGFKINASNIGMNYSSSPAPQEQAEPVYTESAGSIAYLITEASAVGVSSLATDQTTTHRSGLFATFNFDPARTYEYKWNFVGKVNGIPQFNFNNAIRKYIAYEEQYEPTAPVHAGSVSEYGPNNDKVSIQFDQVYSSTLRNGGVTYEVEVFVRDDLGNEQKSIPFTINLVVTATGGSTGGGGGGGCIAMNTPVLMFDGTTKTAETLVVGDEVAGHKMPGMIDESTPGWQDWTTTDHAGERVAARVRSVKHDWYKFYYVINDDIKITTQHEIFVQQDGTWGWRDVSEIRVGDKLLGAHGNLVNVGKVVRIDKPIDVIVLDVESNDTYFAGNNPVLIHNNPDMNKF